MTKTLAAACWLMACLLFVTAAAGAGDSILLYDKMPVPRDATVIDLTGIKVVKVDRLRGYLDQLPHLTRVRMPDSRLSLKDYEALRADYPGIDFDTSFNFIKGPVATGQTAFSTLNRLSDKRYPESKFLPLLYLKDLQGLDLGHNLISDLSFLEGLPELRVLILADNKITDLGPLRQLVHLEYLELFMNDFTDLSPLAELHHLKDLNLCRNRISDVTPLLGLTGLERLWLPDNFLTAEQKAELEAALPDTQIVYEWSRSTDHGWRKHPRYTVIARMFKTGVYEPFE